MYSCNYIHSTALKFRIVFGMTAESQLYLKIHTLSRLSNIVLAHHSKSVRHRTADHYRLASPVLTAGTYCSLPRSPRWCSRWTTGSIFHAQLHAGSVRVELTGQNLSHSRYLPILEFQLIFRRGTRSVSLILESGKQCVWLSTHKSGKQCEC